MGKFAGLYSTSLLLNVFVNRTVIYVLDFKIPILKQFDVIMQLAWLCATGASTVFNYVGQKFWVFKTIVGEKVDLTSVGQSYEKRLSKTELTIAELSRAELERR